MPCTRRSLGEEKGPSCQDHPIPAQLLVACISVQFLPPSNVIVTGHPCYCLQRDKECMGLGSGFAFPALGILMQPPAAWVKGDTGWGRVPVCRPHATSSPRPRTRCAADTALHRSPTASPACCRRGAARGPRQREPVSEGRDAAAPPGGAEAVAPLLPPAARQARPSLGSQPGAGFPLAAAAPSKSGVVPAAARLSSWSSRAGRSIRKHIT